MGDMAEVFNDMKAAKKEERAARETASSDVLKRAGVDFLVQSAGVLRANTSRGAIMYYPGSNKWQHKGKVYRGSPEQFANWTTNFIRMNPPEVAE